MKLYFARILVVFSVIFLWLSSRQLTPRTPRAAKSLSPTPA